LYGKKKKEKEKRKKKKREPWGGSRVAAAHCASSSINKTKQHTLAAAS